MQFLNLEQLLEHLQQIGPENHVTTKNWSAAQNFYHLASAFEGSMNPLPAGYPFLVRAVVRPFRWIITRYRFPPWLPIPATAKHKLAPPEDVDFQQQKDRLLQVIDLFQQFQQNHPAHPVLGSLTHDEWTGFHLRHCSHHLSFIKLKNE